MDEKWCDIQNVKVDLFDSLLKFQKTINKIILLTSFRNNFEYYKNLRDKVIKSKVKNIQLVENQNLFNWLICQQMITNGACECTFGRNQIASLCGGDPLNLDCPLRLSSPNNEVFDKIKELEQMTWENIEHREQKVKDITTEIEMLLQDIEDGDEVENKLIKLRLMVFIFHLQIRI